VGKKILKKIHGPMYENGSWTIRMNKKIYKKFKSTGIVTVMKACRRNGLGVL
jgi:hypothetical protein